MYIFSVYEMSSAITSHFLYSSILIYLFILTSFFIVEQDALYNTSVGIRNYSSSLSCAFCGHVCICKVSIKYLTILSP